MSFGGGSTGASRISGATDVVFGLVASGDLLAYDSTVAKWKNVSPSTIDAVSDGSITSSKIANGTILDTDISSSAAISQSKVSGLATDLSAKLGRPLQLSTTAAIPNNTAPTFIIRS